MSQVDLSGLVAIVTGAGGGLGRAHALALASRGAAVVVNNLVAADSSPADLVVEEIIAAGGTAISDTNTVGDEFAGQAIVKTALEAFERVDIVVNNAGVVRDSSFAKMTSAQLEEVFSVHLDGAFHLTKAAWPHMREQQFGRIIFTTSAAGILGNFGQANYAAAKAGVLGLTRTLAIEGAKNNITANAIAPVAKTSMTESLLSEFLIDRVDPRLVAPVVVWLSSPECSESGSVYSVGGGRVARFATALTEGWTRVEGDLTPEDVQAHWAEINDDSRVTFPKELNDDFRALKRALSA